MFGTVSPTAAAIAWVHTQWLTHRPTSAALLGNGLQAEHVEDLSEAGLDAWEQVVSALETRVRDVAAEDATAVTRAGAAGLQDFVAQERRRDRATGLRTQASGYFELVSHRLLLAYVTAETTGDELAHGSAIDHCSGWLRAARQRAASGSGLVISAGDRARATLLAEWVTAKLPKTAEHGRFLDELAQWQSLASRSGPAAVRSRVSWREYARDFVDRDLEVTGMVGWLRDEVVTCQTLAAEAAAGSASQVECAGPADFLRSVYQLSRSALNLPTAPVSDIAVLPAPQFLGPDAETAVLFPPGTIAARKDLATLLVPRRLFVDFERLRATGLLRLAVTALHELHPGHLTHLALASGGPLADLYRVVRSPGGFEGWATYAEGFAPHLETLLPGIQRAALLQWLRRVQDCLVLLAPSLASGHPASFLDSLSESERAWLTDPNRRPTALLLVYVAGRIATKQALAQLIDSREAVSGDAIHKYLTAGPLAPSLAALLARELQAEPSAHRSVGVSVTGAT